MSRDELRVLWIEEELDATLGTELLRAAGVDAVERCASLAAARERLASGQTPAPTVVLLDSRLAEGDALVELALAGASLPIVVWSPNDDPARARDWIERGAQEVLVSGDTSGAALARSLRQAILRERELAVLRASRDRALLAADAHSAFAAAISHEIRTPLNAILGMSDLLSQTPLDLDQREYVEIFRRCGRSLLGLLDNALELSRLETGRVELAREPFELDALLHECLESFAFVAHRKGLALVDEIADEAIGTVVGDEGRLRQVLFNLVGNAVKFTGSGRVVLRARPTDEPGEIALEVEDTGVGIPADRHRAIFERFVQAESGTTRRFGGSGLGLALCRELVRAMGGRIDVASVPGEGSRFRVSLSLAVEPRAIGTSDLTGLRVLVLLADAVERASLAARLRRRGAEVEEIADAEGAERRLASARPGDALVLDARLRGGGGLELLERMSAEDAPLPARRVVLLPMDHRVGDLGRCRAADAIAFTKPVRWDELEAALLGRHPATGAIAATAPAAPHLAGRRILVAEDVEENRLLVQRYLEPTGADVAVALDGREAVERCDAEAFDLVLMDVHMPLLDGCEATRRIRSRERDAGRPRTPILALTADALPEQRAACRTAGCDGHLGKPFTREGLYRTLRAVLDAPTSASGPAPGPPLAGPAADERPEIPPELADLAEDYLTNRRRDAETLHEAARRGAFEPARRLGHNMKGSGAGYGFRRVSALGAEIEQAAARADAAALQRAAAELDAYAEKYLATLG